MNLPETRYARSDGVNIAYQVAGAGPLDLVLVPGFVSHLEIEWNEPRCVHFFRRLGSFARLIRLVKDLVAGSGIEFEERAERELKGIPGTWRLYAIAAG